MGIVQKTVNSKHVQKSHKYVGEKTKNRTEYKKREIVF